MRLRRPTSGHCDGGTDFCRCASGTDRMRVFEGLRAPAERPAMGILRTRTAVGSGEIESRPVLAGSCELFGSWRARLAVAAAADGRPLDRAFCGGLRWALLHGRPHRAVSRRPPTTTDLARSPWIARPHLPSPGPSLSEACLTGLRRSGAVSRAAAGGLVLARW